MERSTGATISGSSVTFNAVGQVTLKGTIADGLGAGSDYTQNFAINVAADPTPILLQQIATGNKALQTRNGINLTAVSNAHWKFTV